MLFVYLIGVGLAHLIYKLGIFQNSEKVDSEVKVDWESPY